MPRLSAIIITRNEAANIGACLASVAFCDECIVVDCGSSDETVARARAAGARVIHHAWAGFGPQKNFALAQATGDWVLSIDADERISPALAAEITAAVESGTADGYQVPRSSTFCGKTIRHCGWSPDYVLRLFRRGRGRFSNDLVHEHVVCRGPVRRLREPLIHHPIRSRTDVRDKIDRYADAGAAMLLTDGRPVAWWRAPVHGALAFLRVYVVRGGFLDGAAGYGVAQYQAATTYHRYARACRAQRRAVSRQDEAPA
jgi:glycosyltransferase involved in cell wall biosynthesis